MNAVWMLVGLGLAGAIVVALTAWQRRGSPADMGAVSNQWITEHRFGQQNDLRR